MEHSLVFNLLLVAPEHTGSLCLYREVPLEVLPMLQPKRPLSSLVVLPLRSFLVGSLEMLRL